MAIFRLTVQRKVFLAMLTLTAATVAILFASTQWNLTQDFGRFLAENELQRFDGLAERLLADYRRAGNWRLVTEDDRYWPRLLEENRHSGRDNHFERPDHPPLEGHLRGEHHLPRPGGFFPPDKRLLLVDAQGRRVAGDGAENAPSIARPLILDGKIIGQLLLQTPPRPPGGLASAFLLRQSSALWVASGAALLLACIAGWWLARHFLGPIRDLADGAGQVAGGRYGIRIPVRHGDELGDLAEDFNHMAETLARIEESRRQWISDTSHELRTPLAVLRAEIEALQDGVRAPGEASYARLHKQIMQLGKLVDDLRYTLDNGEDGPALDLHPLDPLALLRETAEEYAPRFAAARLTLDNQANGDGPPVSGDADRLRQVFANLLENSLRYTSPGGRLQISAGSANRQLWIHFDDSAPAPPAAALPRLFERFFRAEPSRSRAHGGSGLGLSICKTLLEAHGGAIEAALSPLGGLAIHLTLPLES